MDSASVVWQEIQKAIWHCDRCKDFHKVECNIRQQTELHRRSVRLLVVGIAPPYKKSVQEQLPAKSATNDPNDNLRKFIADALELEWSELLDRGLAFIHAVKCAIAPEKAGFENPPIEVIDLCAPYHFGRELQLIEPGRVIAFGKAPVRSILRTHGCSVPSKIKLSSKLKDIRGEYKGVIREKALILHLTYFPRAGNKKKAGEDLVRAAKMSGIIRH